MKFSAPHDCPITFACCFRKIVTSGNASFSDRVGYLALTHSDGEPRSSASKLDGTGRGPARRHSLRPSMRVGFERLVYPIIEIIAHRRKNCLQRRIRMPIVARVTLSPAVSFHEKREGSQCRLS